jgi:peptide/nickel transport system ATP-binding protein
MSVLAVEGLHAYYRTSALGVARDVRAVDGVSFTVEAGEIYGLAGESSSGKTTLIKTIAAATQPPLEVVAGTITFNFPSGAIEMQRVDRHALAPRCSASTGTP